MADLYPRVPKYIRQLEDQGQSRKLPLWMIKYFQKVRENAQRVPALKRPSGSPIEIIDLLNAESEDDYSEIENEIEESPMLLFHPAIFTKKPDPQPQPQIVETNMMSKNPGNTIGGPPPWRIKFIDEDPSTLGNNNNNNNKPCLFSSPCFPDIIGDIRESEGNAPKHVCHLPALCGTHSWVHRLLFCGAREEVRKPQLPPMEWGIGPTPVVPPCTDLGLSNHLICYLLKHGPPLVVTYPELLQLDTC